MEQTGDSWEIASDILRFAFFLDGVPKQTRNIGAAEFLHFANTCR
jgi:hypothetical protein